MTTTLADLEKRVKDLEDKVAALSTQSNSKSAVRDLRDALEGVLDHVYGVNVRPPVRERTADEYPARVVPTNADEGTDQFKKDVGD